MSKSLPDSPYFLLSDLAKDWACSEEKIIDYGIRGKLKICALGGYWTLQEGYFSDDAPDGFPVPTEKRGTGLKPIPLTCFALRQILSDGEVTDPEFIFEADGTQDQCKGSEEYERFLSSVLISQDIKSSHGKVIVKKTNLVIRKEDAEAFFVANNDQVSHEDKIYDLSTMKKEDREMLVLEYAASVWEEYQNEHEGKPPRIGYVHGKIKQNPSFTYSLNRPSIKTILKPVTEEAVFKKSQSRRNAEKRA